MLQSNLIEILKDSRELKNKQFTNSGEDAPTLSGSELMAFAIGARIAYMTPLPGEPVSIINQYYNNNVLPEVIKLVDALNEVEPILIRQTLDTAKAVYIRRYKQAFTVDLDLHRVLTDVVPEAKLQAYWAVLDDSTAKSFVNRVLSAD